MKSASSVICVNNFYTSLEPSFSEQLIAHVAKVLDINPEFLHEKCRRTRLKFGRWMVWEIMVAHKAFTLSDAGGIFGDYDHSSVHHALTQLPIDLQNDDFMRTKYESIVLAMGIPMEDIYNMRAKRAFEKKAKAIQNQSKL